jgi:Uma2 family endonuclease
VDGDPSEEEPMIDAPNLPDKHVWTVDDVAKLPEDLPYELIDGKLILSPSPLPFHQFLGLRVANALEVACPEDVLVTVDQSVLMDFLNEPRPDVAVIREEGAGRTPVLSADVLLAAEILSPESINRDTEKKLEIYAYGGIPYYWIIDPMGEAITFTEYHLGPSGGYQRQMWADGVVRIDRPWPLVLDLPAWTRRRDRLREAARTT